MQVDDISFNSEKSCINKVFVCIKGALADGHHYAMKAIEKGARAVVFSNEEEMPPLIYGKKEITIIKVEDTREALAVMSANLFRNPAKELITVGVTGTKGKTTTTYMLKALLAQGGYKVGLIGTIEIDTKSRVIESSNTTPESYEIQGYLREMVDNGCQVAIMEVSSQGLKLKRVFGINFDYGVFTNLEKDHLGPFEHEDFREYLFWKAELFKMCKFGIINIDDEHYEEIIKDATCEISTFGFNPKGDLWAEGYYPVKSKNKLGVEISLKGVYNIYLAVNIFGKFTAYNVMAALMVARNFSLSGEAIKTALSTLGVRGRAETIFLHTGGIIVIDYAHNGVALEALLKALGEYDFKIIMCVFGCGGMRDRQRRFDMGKASAKFANISIITSDNPRNEFPMAIIDDIIIGVKKYEGKYIVISDREKAIEYAVRNCKKDEIAVICGKGHETYQIINDRKIHFDDKEQVLKSMEKVRNEQDNNRRNNKSH